MMKSSLPFIKSCVFLSLAFLAMVACQPAEEPAVEPTQGPSMTPVGTPFDMTPDMDHDMTPTPTPTPADGLPLGDQSSQSMPAAPALQVADWIKGEPVTLADGKGEQVYVVEFWATWCPPCRASIPHLTEMQKKYVDKGVTFIGISAEKDAKLVRDFVEKMGDKMGYTVALDDQRATDIAYNQAHGVGSIPHAYVIDKNGAIAWHGHPMDPKMENLLESLTS